MKYWIVVVSKDHMLRGVSGGFIQANHGKQAPLKRMTKGDGVIGYSPRQSYEGKEPCQAFTAIGVIADHEVHQHKLSENFMPYRRKINYFNCNETPIIPLIEQLDFIKNKKAWGFQFRFGFFEIPEKDFKLIKEKMTDNYV